MWRSVACPYCEYESLQSDCAARLWDNRAGARTDVAHPPKGRSTRAADVTRQECSRAREGRQAQSGTLSKRRTLPIYAEVVRESEATGTTAANRGLGFDSEDAAAPGVLKDIIDIFGRCCKDLWKISLKEGTRSSKGHLLGIRFETD